MRDIELENIRKLKHMEDIEVISDFYDIKNLIIRKIEKNQ